ncbi:PJA2 ligase, partial [Galbula dea]|nr:PJA2 ligase [Galbula dea]
LDNPLLENIGSEEPICQSISNQTFGMNASAFSLFSYGLEGNTISANLFNPYEDSEDFAEYVSGGHNDFNSQNGITFLNIDSYELDISDSEEDDAQDRFSLAREETGVFQKTLSGLENGLESATDLESRLSALKHSISRECCEEVGQMPLMKYFGIDSDLACSNSRTFKSFTEDQAMLKSSATGTNYETQWIKTLVDVGIQTTPASANEFNDGKTDEGNSPELVVRPKVRKQNVPNQWEREKILHNDDEEESGCWRKNEIGEVLQGCAACALGNSKEMSSNRLLESRECEGCQKNTEIDLKKNAAVQEQENILDYSTFGNDFEDYCRHFSISHSDENSSEYSDGECSPGRLTSFTATEEGYWETVPGGEDRHLQVQSSSSSVEEENTDFCFQGWEEPLLEDGEILWLRYWEDVQSSSDEQDDPVSDFVHPGFFLLDGNNNLEDNSSVSENLDVEWRQLDEFGGGLGLAHAVPYLNLQFVAVMSLEARLQEAMEAALVHLESFGFDDEQPPPPAPKETVDRLPQITITDDRNGQEQCCIICCSEYERGEIITELPCHHFFHRRCVTLWLQESGTCPVCRHVLAPVFPEAAAANAPFPSDHGSTSS